MGVSGQLHVPAALTPAKEPPVPIHWIGDWVEPKARLDAVVTRRKESASARNCTPLVQPLA